ncbi:hypothetical protein [Pseudomonas brassicacearum]|uniref:hypothetical protein n=1 Tax=Pseudomonas brassicacearum TaxID=930166 RepID=UPI0011F214C2|nr:hypothetical protein [Pseudomonas brassicacearum]QEO78820.1 hypothetical protein ELZ14_15090 [Pseudomonas brassicacearum]
MRIAQDSQSDEVLRIEHLLEGFNYTVWVNIYGPFDSNISLEDQLSHSVGKDVVVGNQTCVSASEARNDVIEHLLHPGDGGYGPINLTAKRAEILVLIEALLTFVNLDQASLITSFWLAKGHPAYPVFWDFSFDIHAHEKRWILMGSSSD